ncbi:MAG: DUF4437 domain-containing protein [Gammaproteobacteria bacterium]|nr:DUF4437 domain-containing protein [Gammaproteobacteria bacterium]
MPLHQVATDATAKSSVRVVLASDVEWEALNPARGESSPRAGTLWGDRNGEQPTGFLARFADGFSSPPHIHNVTYRAVVIEGGIHNDDPDAAKMWMQNSSFWTQPMGETHITAAKGANNIALVEIDRGPYLVHTPVQAFVSGERPVNLDASNVVWLPLPQRKGEKSGARISYLWGTFGGSDWNGSFVYLPAGFEGVLKSEGVAFHGVVIRGQLKYRNDGTMNLTPGSYFGAQGATEHQIASGADAESIIYVSTNGAYRLRNYD